MNPIHRTAPWSGWLTASAATVVLSGCAPERDTRRPLLAGERLTPVGFVELTAQVDAIRVEADIPGLSLGLVERGELVWAVGLGTRDVLNDQPVEASTPFLTASVSKTVVAVAAARVASAGRLDLDAPVDDLLEGAYRHPDGSPYSLRQLLTHTAGIVDDWDTLADGYVVGDAEQPLEAWVADYFLPEGALYDAHHNFAPDGPGQARVYSNAGIALAAVVVAEAAGVPFDDWCEAELFGPMGLADTGWHLADLDVEQVALPHVRTSAGPLPIPHYGVPDWPDGQLRASAVDLSLLVASLTEPAAHPSGTLDLLFEVPFPDIDDRQALAWSKRNRAGRTGMWTHGGSEMGAAAEVVLDAETADAVVVLANTDKDTTTTEALRAVAELAFASLTIP